jgi:uncharacterized protein (TIGR00255 family)
MRSMTGFGAAQRNEGALALRAEVRSVNHKFLQLKLRLPNELALLEPEVEELVRERLERGSVALNVTSHGAAALSAIELNLTVAKRYKALLTKLGKELGLEARVTLEDIAKLPGVFTAEPDTKSLSRGRKALLAVVSAALDSLGEMREREGAALAKDLAKHGAAIKKIVADIERRMPVVARTHQENVVRRVNELVGERASAVAPADLAREIALIADKLDVSEEIARLSSHLAQLDVLARKPGSVGRQLEFLIQEFLREANTVGSKCNDATVAHDVIELKTLIERLREQVQNVE